MQSVAAGGVAGYAVCNELFGRIPLRQAAEIAAEQGFQGLELAPFTVFGDFSPAAFRRGVAEARAAFDDSGLRFSGLHWLLVGPPGLRITTADAEVRRRSWDHLRRLVDAAGELGGGNLILGSPKQRSTEPGQSREQAIAILGDELAAIGPHAAQRGCAILLEALSSDQTDVVNRLDEAAAIVARAGSAGVGGMFDFHNCTDETEPYAALIERHFAMIRHVHLNDPDGGHPKPGDTAYVDAFRTLRARDYRGWISLEIFTTPPDPAAVLRETRNYLDTIERAVDGTD